MAWGTPQLPMVYTDLARTAAFVSKLPPLLPMPLGPGEEKNSCFGLPGCQMKPTLIDQNHDNFFVFEIFILSAEKSTH